MFEVKIETDNAAFEDDASTEIARILREVIARIAEGYRGGTLADANGNRVGSFMWPL